MSFEQLFFGTICVTTKIYKVI